MQIVIDIPEEKYQGIVNMAEEILDASTFCSPRYLYKAVLNGTPLPKKHGRLIDADDLIQEFSVVSSRPIKSQLYILKEAPTIIEADKSESEG